MQDDCYLIAADGWVAKTARILETDKKGKTKDKGWTCDLIPKPLHRRALLRQGAGGASTPRRPSCEAATASLAELEEEHGGEEGFLGALDKIAKAEVSARLKEIKGDKDGEGRGGRAQALAGAVRERDRAQARGEGAGGRARQARLRQVPHAHRGRDQDAGGGRQVDGAPRRPPCRASWTASRRPSPAASASWPNATPRRCRSSPTKWRRSPRGWRSTSRRWGRHGSEARIQADGGGGHSGGVGASDLLARSAMSETARTTQPRVVQGRRFHPSRRQNIVDGRLDLRATCNFIPERCGSNSSRRSKVDRTTSCSSMMAQSEALYLVDARPDACINERRTHQTSDGRSRRISSVSSSSGVPEVDLADNRDGRHPNDLMLTRSSCASFPFPLPTSRTTRHRGGVERCGCAAGRAGPAHRQEARPQAGRHAATPHRPDPPPRLPRGVGGEAAWEMSLNQKRRAHHECQLTSSQNSRITEGTASGYLH